MEKFANVREAPRRRAKRLGMIATQAGNGLRGRESIFTQNIRRLKRLTNTCDADRRHPRRLANVYNVARRQMLPVLKLYRSDAPPFSLPVYKGNG